MNNSMNDLPTSTSQLFNTGAGRRLSGVVVRPDELSQSQRHQMYDLLEAYFVGTRRSQFDRDLAEKESVILLRDEISGAIHGFSTFMRMFATIEDRPIVAFFSGDTIIAREYWGDTLLSRLWSQTIFAEAELIRIASPGAKIYWFLICSGYRTWRFLPVFFREFYPNPHSATPAFEQKILDVLGTKKFGEEYVSSCGVVRFHHPTPLHPGVSDLTEERRRDKSIAFFERVNPGHARGDELACLTEISSQNLTRAGARMVGGGLHLTPPVHVRSQ
jgi:hypothetical protein